MGRGEANEGRLPKGVARLPRERGGRAFLARIKQGKAGEVHLGLYPTRWLAAFAYNVAAQAVGRSDPGGPPPTEIPRAEQPSADEVRRITAIVRRRLGLDPEPRPPADAAPEPDRLLGSFEATAVAYWRDQVSEPDPALRVAPEVAARRLVEAARVAFWCHSAGHPTPEAALAELVARRLDRIFRRDDLARAILDDDGDDPDRLAGWLVLPEAPAAGNGRGFRAEVAFLHPDAFGDEPSAPEPGSTPAWAVVLGVAPPFAAECVRRAFRERSRTAHPDGGGSHAEFVRLRSAYEQARRDCATWGV